MALNTSSKICISKRLTIASLLLIAIGFSIIVFSTLSSSVNKTTSSKAAGAESVALRDIGGKNQPCLFVSTRGPNYSCNPDTNLVCDGPLDFWLSSDGKKAQLRKEDKGPRCIEPADVPMGKEGQPCRGAISGSKQCDSGLVCVDVIGDELPHLSTTYQNYFDTKYKSKETYFELWAIVKYFNIPTDGSLVGTYGVCIPESFSKVESCGDAGQKACKNELGQDFCFGDNRVTVVDQSGATKCTVRITVGSKGFLKCDDQSNSCSEFCSNQKAKCVDSCDKKLVIKGGDEYYEVTKQVGAYLSDAIESNAAIGTCNQEGFVKPNYGAIPLRLVCNGTYQTYCCCDKK